MNYTFSDRMSSLKPSIIREMFKFTQDPTVISFAAGNPSADSFPLDAVRKFADEILAETPVLALQYGISEGYAPLRQKIAEMMTERYSVPSALENIIMTSGAQQAIELSCKILTNEGDTVICEAPSFIGSLNSFRSYKVNLKGVDLKADGPDLEQMENILKADKRVRFIYLIPNFQNPTGITSSLENRKAVYALARKYDVIILEDNPYGELRFEGENIPAVKTLDEDGRVIYCGTFSKILSPGLRVGYACASKEIIQKLVVGKQCSDVHTALLSQLICYRFMTETDFEKHIAGVRAIYRQKCKLMLECLDRELPAEVSHTSPEGGLFIWCTFPKGTDVAAFCEKCGQNKVAVVPGAAFNIDQTAPYDSIRLNFSSSTDEQIEKGIAIVGKTAREFLR